MSDNKMFFQTINIDKQGDITYVMLNRPEIRNAMNKTMIQELRNCFIEIDSDTDTRIVVLSGNGKSFCAGADLQYMKEIGAMNRDENIEAGVILGQMYTAINTCSKPVIGKVHGHAYGGGFGLCSVCDIVIAVQNTSFCLSEVLIGIVPAVLGPFSKEKIGFSHFRALGISGENFDGLHAQKIGLVHKVCSEEKLNEVVQNTVRQLKKASPQAITKFKEYCRNMEGTNSAELIAELRSTDEGLEGLTAFLEKRVPKWAK